MLECPALGTLKRLRIGHNNSGLSAGWFLDKVIVDDLETNRVYEFPCHRWLAKDEDDGQISRELLCVGVGTEGAFERRRCSVNASLTLGTFQESCRIRLPNLFDALSILVI